MQTENLASVRVSHRDHAVSAMSNGGSIRRHESQENLVTLEPHDIQKSVRISTARDFDASIPENLTRRSQMSNNVISRVRIFNSSLIQPSHYHQNSMFDNVHSNQRKHYARRHSHVHNSQEIRKGSVSLNTKSNISNNKLNMSNKSNKSNKSSRRSSKHSKRSNSISNKENRSANYKSKSIIINENKQLSLHSSQEGGFEKPVNITLTQEIFDHCKFSNCVRFTFSKFGGPYRNYALSYCVPR